MRILVFILVVSLIVALGYAYAGWRLIARSGMDGARRRVAWSVLVILYLLPIGMFLLQIVGAWGPSSSVVVWPAYLTLAFASFTVTLLLLRDLAFLAMKATAKLVGQWPGGSLEASSVSSEKEGGNPRSFSPQRRQFLVNASSLGVLGGAALCTGYGVVEARRTPTVVPVEIPITGLHPDLDGFTILQITDLHIGLTVGREFVQSVTARSNRLAPDLVVFTGDLVDGSVPALQEAVEPMGTLSSVHGRYFVTGNHEYYSGVEPWIDEVRRLGYQVLLNEHTLIGRGQGKILLAGVTDPTGGDFLGSHATSVAKAVEGAPDAHVRILLAHQPKSIFEAAGLGMDLQLSGHTHGGQFVPWSFFAAMAQPYVSGLHRHENTWVYVSKGTGYWGPPVRVGAHSEITLVRLRRAGGGSVSGGA